MEFKERIHQLREDEKLSYTELANIFKKSEAAVRSWESGRAKPDADTFIRLAEYFGCTVDYLLGVDNNKNLESTEFKEKKFQQIYDLLEFYHFPSQEILNEFADILTYSSSDAFTRRGILLLFSNFSDMLKSYGIIMAQSKVETSQYLGFFASYCRLIDTLSDMKNEMKKDLVLKVPLERKSVDIILGIRE